MINLPVETVSGITQRHNFIVCNALYMNLAYQDKLVEIKVKSAFLTKIFILDNFVNL